MVNYVTRIRRLTRFLTAYGRFFFVVVAHSRKCIAPHMSQWLWRQKKKQQWHSALLSNHIIYYDRDQKCQTYKLLKSVFISVCHSFTNRIKSYHTIPLSYACARCPFSRPFLETTPNRWRKINPTLCSRIHLNSFVKCGTVEQSTFGLYAFCVYA